MSNDGADKTHRMDGELQNVIDRIASTQPPIHAVSDLIANVRGLSETPDSFNANDPVTDSLVANELAKEETMSNLNTGKLSVLKWSTIAAIAAGLVLTMGMMFSPGQANLFAEMQKALAEIQTIQCSNTLFLPGEAKPWKTAKFYIEEPDRSREEVTSKQMGHVITVYDLSTAKMASWAPASKRAMVGSIPNVAQVRGLMDLFVGILRNADAEDATEVERFEIDGASTVKYQYPLILNGGALTVKVDVDEASSLPVKIEFYDAKGNLEREITDIIFDKVIDPKLFSTQPPAGYQVVTPKTK